MKFSKRNMTIILYVLLSLLLLGPINLHNTLGEDNTAFSFTITSDIRGYTNLGEYPAVLDAINVAGGPGDFMLVVGDFAPPSKIDESLRAKFGFNFTWYPIMGNHELDSLSHVDWITNNFHNLPDIVNLGPANSENTTYSFDYDIAHFVVLNEYYTGSNNTITDGDIVPLLLNWLEADLSNTNKTWIFVMGHEPAYPQPDQNWGDTRHVGDSLDKYPDNRDAFWALLDFYNVTAYICGHTHRYSGFLKDNIWQIDAAQARGTSKYDTFLKVNVDNNLTTFVTYRSLNGTFSITDTIEIVNQTNITLTPTPGPTPTITSASSPSPIASPTSSLSPSPTPEPTPSHSLVPKPSPDSGFNLPLEYAIAGIIVIAVIGLVVFLLGRK